MGLLDTLTKAAIGAARGAAKALQEDDEDQDEDQDDVDGRPNDRANASSDDGDDPPRPKGAIAKPQPPGAGLNPKPGGFVGNSGLGDDDAPSADQMAAVLRSTGLAEATDEKPRALFHDPYSVMDWGGWRERPNALTYSTLQQMASQNTAIAAIIQVRTSQVGAFGKPQQGRYDRGYRVTLRDRRDQKRGMSKQEALQAAEIERMLESTAVLLPGEKSSDRDSFRTFLKKATRDVLIYDQFCWEKIRDRKGRISRFIALPSETIRPAVADIEHIDAIEMRQRVSHVQVYEDTVIAEFSPDDIAWCIMNPRTDLRVNSFGYSPVEQLANLVTAWLYGFQYNQKFFTQGANVKGVLNIKGSIPDRQLKSFRRLWYSMVSGVNNAWRTPILNSEDIQWVPMHSTNSEMEYSAWMDWLTKLTCAVFGIDPTEINFIFGNTGQTGAMSSARPNEDEVVESKDKGLTPLMEFFEDCINSHLVWELNPDFEFNFAGLNSKEEKAQREGWIAQGKAFKTVDEIRAEQDLDPMPDKKGEVILDSVWLQNSQAQQQGGEQDGGGDEPPLEHIPGEDDDDQGGGGIGSGDTDYGDDDFGDDDYGDDSADDEPLPGDAPEGSEGDDDQEGDQAGPADEGDDQFPPGQGDEDQPDEGQGDEAKPGADKIPGGLGDKKDPRDFDPEQLARGTEVESEHSADPKVAQEIAMDHLSEDPKYYDKLAAVEDDDQSPAQKQAKAVEKSMDAALARVRLATATVSTPRRATTTLRKSIAKASKQVKRTPPRVRRTFRIGE